MQVEANSKITMTEAEIRALVAKELSTKNNIHIATDRITFMNDNSDALCGCYMNITVDELIAIHSPKPYVKLGDV